MKTEPMKMTRSILRALTLLFAVTGLFGSAAVAEQASQQDGGRVWAILVGVNQYSNGSKQPDAFYLPDLKYAVNDVRHVERALREGGVDAARIVSMNDDSGIAPTSEAFLDQLSELAENPDVTSDDTLLFVFCGHGLNIGDTSYLCFRDCVLSGNKANRNSQVVPRGVVDIPLLMEMLEEVNAGSKIILTDACRNWADADSAEMQSARHYDITAHVHNMAESGDGSNQQLVISSCLPGQISLEDPEARHGVFMSYVVEALEGKADFEIAGNRDGSLRIIEVFRYASQKTRTRSLEMGLRQVPFLEGAFSIGCELVALPQPVRQELAREYDSGDLYAPKLTYEQEYARELHAQSIESILIDVDAVIEKCTKARELDAEFKLPLSLRKTAYVLNLKYPEAIDDAREIDGKVQFRVDAASPISLKSGQDVLGVVENLDTIEITKYSQDRQWVYVSRTKPRGASEWDASAHGYVKVSQIVPNVISTIQSYQTETQQQVKSSRELRQYGQVSRNQSVARPIDRIDRAVTAISQVSGRVNEVKAIVDRVQGLQNLQNLPSGVRRGVSVPIPSVNQFRSIRGRLPF